ncbi:MAG TPA: CPBP family intramembrane glutamic endopeptidase [Gemmataceae bacterium]|nr:CPBP family intramembrane glutamic endopeptidase [Gemmataceae bacterium]
MHDTPPTRLQIVRLAVLFEGGLGVLACLLGWLTGVPTWERLSWSAVDAGFGLLAALPMLALLVVFGIIPWAPFRPIEQFIDKIVRPLFRHCTVADLALIALVAGLGEELLFRGLLQEVFARWLETWAAVLVTAILFGLMHPITPTYGVLATLAGAYLGYVYLASGNLLVAVVAHAFYDFAALVYLLSWTSPASDPKEHPLAG